MAQRVLWDSGNVAAAGALPAVPIALERLTFGAAYVTYGNAGNAASWEGSPDGVNWFPSSAGSLALGYNTIQLQPNIYMRVNVTAYVAGNDRFILIADVDGG